MTCQAKPYPYMTSQQAREQIEVTEAMYQREARVLRRIYEELAATEPRTIEAMQLRAHATSQQDFLQVIRRRLDGQRHVLAECERAERRDGKAWG